MAASSSGTSRVELCAGRASIPRAPSAWPFLRMAVSSPVEGQGHSAMIYSLAFTPDSGHLLSGSADGTLRLWEVERGQGVRVLQGYVASLFDVDWSPDGTQLASSGTDTQVTVWEVASGRT